MPTKPHQCEACCKGFDTPEALAQHARDAHEREASRIVKVQLSLERCPAGTPRALIYDEARQWKGEFDCPVELFSLMDGRVKAFFYAQRAEGGTLALGNEAPWQEW